MAGTLCSAHGAESWREMLARSEFWCDFAPTLRAGQEEAGLRTRVRSPTTFATSGGGMTGSVLDAVLADLTAETADLDVRVAGLTAVQWQSPTPAEGWTIAHQIAHLAWTDQAALLAMERPDEFVRQIADLWSAQSSPVDAAAEEGARRSPDELLEGWRSGRRALHTALVAWPTGERIRWFGPPMSPASMATARLMETWAHGLDVAEALGDRPEPTDRIRHVCHLGVRTRDFSYAQRGLPP